MRLTVSGASTVAQRNKAGADRSMAKVGPIAIHGDSSRLYKGAALDCTQGTALDCSVHSDHKQVPLIKARHGIIRL